MAEADTPPPTNRNSTQPPGGIRIDALEGDELDRALDAPKPERPNRRNR